jgi:tetratricopeptide (TPR) repeat protein
MESLPLGERIREARLERKMTQDELARDTFSKSYVSAVELGKIQPSIKALRILARRLQLPPSFFLESLQPDLETQQTLLTLAELRLLVAQGQNQEEVLTEIANFDQERLNEHQLAEVLYLEGRALSRLNRDTEALTRLEQSRLQWEELDEIEWVERVRNFIAEIHFRQRKYLQAQDLHKLSLAAIKQGNVRDVSLKLSIYANLARVYSALDMHDAARALFEEANEVAESVSSFTRLIETQQQIAASYITEERYMAARQVLEQANAAFDIVETSKQVTNLHQVFGQVYSAGHNWEEAEACYRAALESLPFQSATLTNISAYTNLAQLYLRQNKLDEASQSAAQAWSILEKIGAPETKTDQDYNLQRSAGEVLLVQARICEKQGDTAKADKLFADALERLKTSGDNELLSGAYFSYGEALLTRGEAQKGAQYLKLAYEERSKGAS